MDNCGNLEDVKLNQDSYANVWRKFVKAHEEYIECLDVLARYEELDRANDLCTLLSIRQWRQLSLS